MAFSAIVTAAIAVVVLVVVIILLSNKFHLFGQETDKCNGRCVSPKDCSMLTSSKFGCPNGQVCCVGYCEDNDGICKDKCSDDELKNAYYRCEGKNQVCCLKR